MKTIFMFTALIVSFSSFAKDVSFWCVVNNGKATFKGKLNTKKATLGFIDNTYELGILDGDGEKARFDKDIVFNRNLRESEAKYSTAKFVSDYNPWQYLVISFPKNVMSGTKVGNFTAYYNLMEDQGERYASLAQSFNLKCKTLD